MSTKTKEEPTLYAESFAIDNWRSSDRREAVDISGERDVLSRSYGVPQPHRQ
jgi:hypothetical protein